MSGCDIPSLGIPTIPTMTNSNDLAILDQGSPPPPCIDEPTTTSHGIGVRTPPQ